MGGGWVVVIEGSGWSLFANYLLLFLLEVVGSPAKSPDPNN
jgi:hypothetical protein